MEPRPEVNHEGQRFTRQNGSWVNAQRLKVPAAMASRLDCTAKTDPSLWARCIAQDLSDRMPSAAGQGEDNELGPAPIGRARTGASSLQCSFDAARTLFIAADIRKGWRERQKTFGFVGQDLLPALNGHTARVQLAVLSTWPHHEPRLVAAEGDDRGIGCCVDTHRITLAVELFDEHQLFNARLEWTETKNGKPQVFRDVSPSLLRFRRDNPSDPFVDYLFKLWLIIQPPVRKPAPIYFEWSKRFFPGGLPSLGKRHS